MTKRKIIFQILILLITAPATFSQNNRIDIEGHDRLRYSVETIQAQADEKLTIHLKTISNMDKSQMAHNWVLLKQGTDALDFVTKGLQHPENDYIDPELRDRIIAKTDMLGGGEEDTIIFTVPDKKGEYQYVCTFRAHFQAGMKGKLIVE